VVFVNRVLRKIFGPKRGVVTGDWIILCNEDLHDLYSSANMWVSDKEEENGQHLSRVWRRGAYRILVGKPAGKRLPGRPRHRWENNIKMDLREVGSEVLDWTDWLRIVTRGGLL
jgi:hypothetical protein